MNNIQPISPLMYKMMPWIAAIAFFMQSLDSSILITALPSMARDLNESPLNMQSAVISYALTVALFIPVSGFLADRFGTRNVFVFAVFLFSAGSLVCAMSQTLIVLDIARIIQGIGGSMMVPVSRLTLIKSFKRSDFLAALNASTLLGLVGPVIGPVVGGYLVELVSWHWIFLINIPIGVVGIIAGWKFLPNIKGEESYFDCIGILLVAFSVISLTLGLELVNAEFNTYYSFGLFALGIALLILYFLYAKKTAHPIFPLNLFSIRTFTIGISGSLVSRLGIAAAPFLVPLLLQVAFGYSAIEAGLILTPMALGSIISKTLVEHVLRRFGYRKVLMINTVAVSLIIISISLLSPQTPIIMMCMLLFCLGAANSLQFTSMNSITLADLSGNLTSSGNSLMAVNQQLAISFGIALGAVLVRLFSNDVSGAHHDIAYAFRMSFIILGIVTFLSSFIFQRLDINDGNNLTKKTIIDEKRKKNAI